MFQVVEVKFIVANAIASTDAAPKPRVVKTFEKRMAAKEYAAKLNHKHDLVSLDSITNYHVKEVRDGTR
jgi:hypothetical protein